jgi:6-phosphogluconolactonase/glucosamine-6-phosphate isomerase/deaminase
MQFKRFDNRTELGEAAAACFNGGVTPMTPASTLRNHSKASLYFATDSAALLESSLGSAGTRS